MTVLSWRFASNDLKVAADPSPTRSSGYEKIRFRPPGADGISAKIPNGRLPAMIAVTVIARTYAEYELLSALFDSGVDGDLEVPHDGDAWVYLDAEVDEKVRWEEVAHEDLVEEVLYRARVEFLCPDPRPRWKSTGERVY